MFSEFFITITNFKLKIFKQKNMNTLILFAMHSTLTFFRKKCLLSLVKCKINLKLKYRIIANFRIKHKKKTFF